MVNNYPVSNIELLESRYGLKEPYINLSYLNDVLHHRFLPTLLEAINPLRVMRYKNTFYALEYIDELYWLKEHYPSLEVSIVEVKSTKNITDIEKKICSTYFYKHTTSINNKDLYALEHYWKTKEIHEPYLELKEHTKMLGCNRSLPSRHKETLYKRQALNTQSNPSASTFSFEDATSHIPNKE